MFSQQEIDYALREASKSLLVVRYQVAGTTHEQFFHYTEQAHANAYYDMQEHKGYHPQLDWIA